ncbi:MAG: hypothetical protein SOT28_11800, partial [Fusicatenibacter sp.]|nr:hypothetical protein [Fusicatenibacter sp.]
MKKRVFTILICILLGFSGCTFEASEEIPELIDPSGTEASCSQVVRGPFCTTEVYEGFTAPETTELSFDREGSIQEILSCPGSYVEEGDPLLKLDTAQEEQKAADLENELEAFKAELAYQQALHENRMEYLQTEKKELAEKSGTGSSEYRLKQLDIEEADLTYEKSIRDLENNLEKTKRSLKETQEQIRQGTITAEHSGYFYPASEIAEDTYVQRGKTVCYITKEDSLVFTTSYLDEATLKNCTLSALIHGSSYEVSVIPLSAEERSALSF